MQHSTAPAAEIRWNMAQDLQSSWGRLADLARTVQPAPVLDPILDRMARVERLGDYDRTESGLIRNRSGRVGGEIMTAQVQSLRSDILVTFIATARKHSRRCLIDGQGTYWIDLGGRAVQVSTGNKYHAALDALWTARKDRP